MKSRLFASAIIALLLATFATPVSAAPSAGDPLCLPDFLAPKPQADCLPYGSTGYFKKLAELGIKLPLKPLAARLIDPQMADLDINYAIVNTMDENGQVIQKPVFATLADAVANTNPRSYVRPGDSAHYVSYTSVQQVDGQSYYFTDLGWMRRSDISPSQVRRFGMGIHFDTTPSRPFGWVLEYAAGEMAPFQARTAPNLGAPRSNSTFGAYDVIEVFDIQQVNDLYWYLVGPDLWLNSLQMRLVFPATEPPPGVDNGRWIEINLEQQSIAVYEDNRMVFATLIATGLDGLWTRPGVFQVYEKHETTAMSGDFSGGAGGYYYLADVPWTLYYDQARAIHGAYWRQKQFFGYQGSHGCVNLPIGDARWIFEWADVGDWVYVHDPSGRTPTDEEFAYGAGAP
ncbi:MAG: L,D-transpeptidase [Anaerolineales bacterium]|nr:L,D-transpeptidase [Anaerolineales bacterium]